MNTSNSKWSSFLFVREGRRQLFFILIMLVGTMFTGHLTPLKISALFQSFSSPDFVHLLSQLAFIFFGQYVLRFGYQYFINRYLQVLVQAVRTRCFSEWMKSYDLDYRGGTLRHQYPMGEVLARVMSDSEAIRELVTSGSFGLLIDIIYVLSGFTALFRLDSGLAIYVLMAEASCLLLLYWGSARMAQAFMDLRTTIGKVSREVANLTGGLAQLYFSPARSFTTIKADGVFDHFFRRQLKVNNYDALFYSFADGLFAVLLVVVALGISLQQQIELAMVAVVIDQIQRAIGPMKGFAGKISNFQRAFTGIKRMQEFINHHQQAWQSPAHLMTPVAGTINELTVSIDHFSYPLRNGQETAFSLKDIHFHLKKGHSLGLVGPSGCGKSTLFSLLSADVLPAQGFIRLSGQLGGQSQSITLSSQVGEDYYRYRQHVSLVTQDSHVFSETLAFNLGLGTYSANDSHLQSFWHEIKEQCPYLVDWGIHLESMISLQNLSSGQKQVIALLRAIFMKRDLILLDEINSGMDSQLELALRKLTLKAQENAMALIVAHRLETVIGADHLLVMNQGQIVGQGRHHDLLQTCPLYDELLKDFKS